MLSHGYYFDDGVEGSSDHTPPNSQPDLALLDETVIELKIKIEALDDLDLLQSLLKAEETGKKRKSAIKSLGFSRPICNLTMCSSFANLKYFLV